MLTSATAVSYLQHHALLTREATGRFRMHPLLRQLAAQKLAAAQPTTLAAQTMLQHSHYYSGLLQSFEHELQRGDGQAALAAIVPEQANLRAGWQHAIDMQQWPIIAKCLRAVQLFYERTGQFREATTLADEALEALEPAAEQQAELLARLLIERAWNYPYFEQLDEAKDSARRASEIANELGNNQIEAHALLMLGQAFVKQNQNEPALVQFEKALALAQTTSDRFLEADCWIAVGSRLLFRPDFRPAEQPLQHALDLSQELQYQRGEMETLHYLSTVAHFNEDFDLFRERTEQFLVMTLQMGHVIGAAEGLGSLGVSLKAQGELIESQRYQEDALAKFQQLAMAESELWLLGELGHTAARLGDYETAETRFDAAIKLAKRIDNTFMLHWWSIQLAALWNEQRKPEQALPLLIQANVTAEEMQSSLMRLRALYEWGNVLVSRSEWQEAGQKFQQVVDECMAVEQVEQALPALAGLAYVAYQQGLFEVARGHAEQLWEALESIEDSAERADLKLFVRLCQVWESLGDTRANDLWKTAQRLLEQRSEKIPDANIRELFLAIPSHRLILQQSNTN